jgi:hypothetical protein
LAICKAKVPTPPDAPLIRTFCPGLHLAVIAKRLQRGQGRRGHGRGLLERQVVRLGNKLVLLGTRVFGACAAAPAEHLVARLEARHVLADGLDAPCQIDPHDEVLLRSREPDVHPDGEGRAPHGEVVTGGQRCRVDAHQHVVIGGNRPVDLLEFEHVRRAVAGLDDGLHGVPPMTTTMFPSFWPVSAYL